MDNGETVTENREDWGPCILGLGTANPPYVVTRDAYVDFVLECYNMPQTCDISNNLKKLSTNTGIETRYFVADDANKKRDGWVHIPKNFPDSIPGMTYRNKVYCEEAPKLAVEAARKAVDDWGGNVEDLTHIIVISCTGVMAPGLEFHVIKQLGLKKNVQRIGMNLMTCYAGLRGIANARALARENPNNRILVVCVEICSIHAQSEISLETFIANSLFADGSAALVVGDKVRPQEKVLWEIDNVASSIVENSTNDMKVEASDSGFIMRLSYKIPFAIKSAVPGFVQELVGDKVDLKQCGMAVHPGGSAIIKGIEESLKLNKWQTQCSWDVMRDYGNMSSVTFLFVLNYLRNNRRPKEQGEYPWTVGLGFGPGISLEGVVLKWH